MWDNLILLHNLVLKLVTVFNKFKNMKNTVKTSIAIVTISFSLMSCQKEYSCVCSQGAYKEIVQANTKTDADKTCDSKGADCEIE